MSKPTNQSVFDKAWQAFVVEKRPASARTSEGGVKCFYRSDVGACAIGLSIPDTLYSTAMEEINIYRMVEHFPEIEDWFSECDTYVLTRLQTSHDNASCFGDQFTSRVEADLREIALEFDLEIPS